MLSVVRSADENPAVKPDQQVLAGLRNEHTRLLFVSSLLGFGFIAVRLLGANGLSLMILLLVGLGFFAVTIGACLLAFHCEILALRRRLDGRAAGLAAPTAGVAETVAQLGFACGLLVVIAGVIVHLSLGGIT